MKNIIITGASGGIGLATAKNLVNDQNRLFLIYNKHSKDVLSLQKKSQKICEIVALKCDLTDELQVKNTIKNIISTYKQIDALINCAGVSSFGLVQDITEKDYDFVFENNFKSVVSIIKYVAKNMIHNQSGKIVNISSMWGVVGASMESLYSASKGALNTFTLSLAKELGPSNITVNAVCPGLIDTKMNKDLSTETIAEIVDNTPIKRIGKPEDVANLVEFLISNKADFITGQIITVDGGLSL